MTGCRPDEHCFVNTPLANTRRESTKSADSFEIKVFSGLNTATSFCCKLDHQVSSSQPETSSSPAGSSSSGSVTI